MNEFLLQHPEITAVLVALGGLIIARLLAFLSDTALTGLEYFLHRISPGWFGDVDLVGYRFVVRGLVFYLTLFFSLLLALHLLNVEIVEEGLDQFTAYLPNVILAAAIMLAGYLIGLLARAAISGALPHSDSRLLPYLTQFIVMLVATLTALSQLAIDITFLTEVITVLIAIFLGGLALAFAFGSRQMVANVLARRELRYYQIGNRIRIGEIEGNIIDILDTAVVLEHQGGTTTVPASRFAAEPVTVVSRESLGKNTGKKTAKKTRKKAEK